MLIRLQLMSIRINRRILEPCSEKMHKLFNSSLKWRILSFFLENPNTASFSNQLGRALDVNNSTASTISKDFSDCGLMKREIMGRTYIYRLNMEHPIVRPLRKAYGISLVMTANPNKTFSDIDEELLSVALIGEFASGTWNENSTVEFLAISDSDDSKMEIIRKIIEGILGRKVSINRIPIDKMDSLRMQNDPAYLEIVSDHVLISGDRII